MDGKHFFPSIAPALGAVELELESQTSAIVGAWSGDGAAGGAVERAVGHIFAKRGKLLRPALVLLSAGLAEPRPRGIALQGSLVRLATAVELIHDASLVHDDIIDNAESRRHQVSLNKRFGNRVAVLAGDILYTNFFSSITGLKNLDQGKRFQLLDIFLDTTKAMCMGEIIAQEVAAAGKPLGVAEYVEIATDKTAVLFAACCRTAAVLCDAPEPLQRCLGEMGLNFGLAFQMADDLVDKDHGLDESVDLERITLSYAQKARDGLAELPGGAHRDSLRDLVEYVISSAIP